MSLRRVELALRSEVHGTMFSPAGQGGSVGPIAGGNPANGYVAEDGVTADVAEDGVTFYVQES